MLKGCPGPLARDYDFTALDLDGVVYVGETVLQSVPETLESLSASGHRLAFITNNASRTPGQVAAKLRALSVPADEEDVVTSAQAGAHLLAQALPRGSKVYVIGGVGLEEALRSFELVPVTEPGVDVRAVAQGYGPEMPWKQVLGGAVLVKQGLPWVATNTDLTIPLPNGIGPGNGALVKLIGDFAGRTPVVAGKPELPLFDETLERVGGMRPLMVGDRLDTDIQGARRAGWASLLVMTGVTGLTELVGAGADARPDFIGADLRALLEPHGIPKQDGQAWELGGWRGWTEANILRIAGDGSLSDWLRVAAVTAWAHLDSRGHSVSVTELPVASVGLSHG